MSVPVFRYLGLALESGFNESPAPAAQIHLDIASATLDAPNSNEVMFEGSLGRAARTHRPGFYSPAGNAVVAIDVDTVGWFLYPGLGGKVFTVDTPQLGQNTHEVYGVNESNLPSVCLRIGKDHFEHVFSGCAINQVALQIADGYGQITVDVAAAQDAAAALQTIDNLILPVSFPLMFHDVTATRDAGDVSAQVKQFTLTIANSVDAPFGRSIGSRHPRRIVANAREITVSAELFFDDTDELERFWGGVSGPSADGTTEFAMDFVLDAGDDGSLTIAAPRVIYTAVNLQPSGRTQMVQAVTMKAYEDTHTLLDATEAESEILCTLVNTTDDMVAV